MFLRLNVLGLQGQKFQVMKSTRWETKDRQVKPTKNPNISSSIKSPLKIQTIK